MNIYNWTNESSPNTQQQQKLLDTSSEEYINSKTEINSPKDDSSYELDSNSYIEDNEVTKYTIQYKNHTLHEPKRGYVQYKKNYLNKNSTDNIIPSLNS